MIPIRNVYYLLAYAWNHLQQDAMAAVGETDFSDLADMLAYVLAEGVNRLVRRGLDRDYVELTTEIAGLRGRIDFGAMLRSNSLANGRTVCRFEELRHDVLQNQILKATLLSVLRFRALDRDVADRVRLAYRRLEGISELTLNRRHFGLVQVHRNNAEYRFLLNLCLLIFENLLVDQEGEHAAFYDFRRDDARMWQIFEQFVLNFFRREQSHFRVTGQKPFGWNDVSAMREVDVAYLPSMKPDVLLEGPRRRIVLDTKYYQSPLEAQFGQPKLHAGNVYQLFAYLSNLNVPELHGPPYEGMLLYAVSDRSFSFDYRLNGQTLRVRSVDLAQPWHEIHEDLLSLVKVT